MKKEYVIAFETPAMGGTVLCVLKDIRFKTEEDAEKSILGMLEFPDSPATHYHILKSYSKK